VKLGRLLRAGTILLTAAAIMPASAAATDIDVNTSLDMNANDGLCSLREAVTAANTNMPVAPAGGDDCPAGQTTLDRVQLDSGTTYLFLTGAADDANASGDLDVNGIGPVSIESTAGNTAPSIDCNDFDRGLHALDTTAGDTLTIDGVRITDCRLAAADGGGGLKINAGASAVVTDTTIDLNEAGTAATPGIHQGGGIMVLGTLVMSSSVVSANSANSSDSIGTGAGIELSTSGNATITGSVVSGNSVNAGGVGAINGAGINNAQGDMILRRTLVTGNQLNGGAMGSRRGAGVVLGLGGSATAAVVNSTISGNTGAFDGGEVQLDGNTPTQIVHSTIVSGGVAGAGDAIQHSDGGPAPDVTVRGSILTGPDAADVCDLGGTTAAFTSGNFNVDRGTSCGLALAGDAQSADPQLAALADNGGPAVGAPGFTQVLRTHAIAAGTPAVDRAPAPCLGDTATPLTTDQRGLLRPSPSAGNCDSGAYELTQAEPPGAGDPPVKKPGGKKCKKKRKKRAGAAAKKKKCKKKKRR
jgi:hypothetical protein